MRIFNKEYVEAERSGDLGALYENLRKLGTREREREKKGQKHKHLTDSIGSKHEVDPKDLEVIPNSIRNITHTAKARDVSDLLNETAEDKEIEESMKQLNYIAQEKEQTRITCISLRATKMKNTYFR